MNIDYLCNHPEFIDTLVDHIWQEWYPDYIAFTKENSKIKLKDFYMKASSENIPICYILIDEKTNNLVSSVLIDHEDMNVRPDLTPWLSSVFTLPKYRSNGFAFQLLDYVCKQHDILYLWCNTDKLGNFYSKYGFTLIDIINNHGKYEEIFIMKKCNI